MTTKIYGTPGTVSHGTLRPSDLIVAFAAELESLDRRERRFDALIEEARLHHVENHDAGSELISDLADALNTFAPADHYFGSHPGDGSDFGFWPNEA